MCQSKVQDSNDEARSDMAEVQDSKGRNNEKKTRRNEEPSIFFCVFFGSLGYFIDIDHLQKQPETTSKKFPKKNTTTVFQALRLGARAETATLSCRSDIQVWMWL